MPQHYPRLPVKAGKARMKLIQAIITGDDELARCVRFAVDNELVLGDQRAIRELKHRLEEILVPEEDGTVLASSSSHLPSRIDQVNAGTSEATS